MALRSYISNYLLKFTVLMKDVKDVYGDSGSTNLNAIIPGGVESGISQSSYFGTR